MIRTWNTFDMRIINMMRRLDDVITNTPMIHPYFHTSQPTSHHTRPLMTFVFIPHHIIIT